MATLMQTVARTLALATHAHSDMPCRVGQTLGWQCTTCGRIEVTGVRLGAS